MLVLVWGKATSTLGSYCQAEVYTPMYVTCDMGPSGLCCLELCLFPQTAKVRPRYDWQEEMLGAKMLGHPEVKV